MDSKVVVDIGRTIKLPVSLGINVAGDAFTSQIRERADGTSTVIATWDVTFVTDGSDGELMLTLDDSVTTAITKSKGYMDIKRVTNGEPVSVFAEPLLVVFQKTVTQ